MTCNVARHFSWVLLPPLHYPLPAVIQRIRDKRAPLQSLPAKKKTRATPGNNALIKRWSQTQQTQQTVAAAPQAQLQTQGPCSIGGPYLQHGCAVKHVPQQQVIVVAALKRLGEGQHHVLR